MNSDSESNIELKEGNSYDTHDSFVEAVTNYAKQQGFQIRLGKIEKNSNGDVRKRTIFCSREGSPIKSLNKNIRNRPSQRCNCKFMIRASLDSITGLWYIISAHLEHNHPMILLNHQHFMINERLIPTEVQEKIKLLRRAGCNIPTIRAILKEEFNGIVTWVYNDLYNYVYQQEGVAERHRLDASNFVRELENIKAENKDFLFEIKVDLTTNEFQHAIWMFPEQRLNYCRFYDVVIFDNTYKTNRFGMPFGIFTGVNNYGQSVCFAGTIMHDETIESFNWVFSNFLKMVNNHAPKVLLTDEDQAMMRAINQSFQPYGTKHALCLWHLLKNVMKNLNGALESSWAKFIKDFYKCLDEYDEEDFMKKWTCLKTNYPSATKYLIKMDKNLQYWAPCHNRKIFMADMTTTQRGESMNNLMKGYMDATTSLSTFLKAFESALDQRKEDLEFMKYREFATNVQLVTKNLVEKQAMQFLTQYALKKTQTQLLESSMYKCYEVR